MVLAAVSVIVFAMIRLIPGDAVAIMLGANTEVTPAAIAALRAQIGLDQPIYVQYFGWMSKVLQGSYNRFVMPAIGGLVSGFGPAYRYLAGSIDAFMTRGQFERLLLDNGFAETSGREMFPPVASLVVGRMPGVAHV